MGALFSFGGRVGRSAYWAVTVATIALYAGYVAWAANLAPRDQNQVYRSYYTGETKVYWGSSHSQLIYFIFAIAAILLLLVSLSVGARRWHDLGKSGWWSLIGAIPLVGPLYAFVMLGFVPGAASPNRYGPAPRSTPLGQGTDERTARSHDPLQALPVATVVSLFGSALTIFVLGEMIFSYGYRYAYDFGFGKFLLVSVAAFAAWLVSSRYGPDLLEQLGFRRVSLVADIVCVIGVVMAGIWFRSFVLILLFTFLAIASRLVALTAYRSITPSLAARFGIAPERVGALFDSFLYGALLIVPFLVPLLQNRLWSVLWHLKLRDFSYFMWFYAAFFAFSAILVAVTIPADTPARAAVVVPNAVPAPTMESAS